MELNSTMKQNRTINDEIEVMISDSLNGIHYPTECTITKTYEDNYVDVEIENGSINYQKCLGSANVGDEGILLFIDNNEDSAVVITDSNISTLLARLALNQSASDKFNFAVITRIETALDESIITNEEFWILSNSYYDYDAKRFVKIDGTHTSFGIQIQANGSYPGEAALGYNDNVGINVWRNPKKSDVYKDTEHYDYTDWDEKNYIGCKRLADEKWVEYGISSGWSNSFMIDSYGGMTIGGAGFEIDGNGIFPFTRLTSSAYRVQRYEDGEPVLDENDEPVYDDYYLLGLLDNAYHPTLFGWDCDSNSYYSWFVGLRFPSAGYLQKDSKNAEFVVMYNDTTPNPNNTHELNVDNWHVVFSVGKDGINVGL